MIMKRAASLLEAFGADGLVLAPLVLTVVEAVGPVLAIGFAPLSEAKLPLDSDVAARILAVVVGTEAPDPSRVITLSPEPAAEFDPKEKNCAKIPSRSLSLQEPDAFPSLHLANT
jgi:hypothetical protein